MVLLSRIIVTEELWFRDHETVRLWNEVSVRLWSLSEGMSCCSTVSVVRGEQERIEVDVEK